MTMSPLPAQTHPLVTQLRFARSELMRCIEGISPEDAARSLGSSNSISWIVAHLATQEHWMWVDIAQGRSVADGLGKRFGYGCAPSTPPLAEVLEIWRTVTAAADPYLDGVTDAIAASHPTWQGSPMNDDVGTSLLRNIWHYWFHTGEAHMIRQQLGHEDLPQFIGRMTHVRWG
jgi:hypothetical protein